MTGAPRIIQLPNLDAPEPAAPSTFELRRFLAGELSPERRAQIEADASLQPRLAALQAEQRADDAAFALEMPLPRLLEEHAKRTQPRGLFAKLASVRFTLGAGALAAAAAAVLVVVIPAQPVDPTDPDVLARAEDRVRSKGGRVGFFVRAGDEGFRFGSEGEELGAGDQIQFHVRDDVARRSMVLVGVDGRGAVTVYAAEGVDRERTKGQERARLLPQSVVLDDATGAERFFVVYGDGAVDELEREVTEAARQLASSGASLVETERLPLAKGYTQSSVHIVKVPSS